jgi:hypothetical protein
LASGTAVSELSSATGEAISISSASRSPNSDGATASAKAAVTAVPSTPTTRQSRTAARSCSLLGVAVCTR